MAQTQAELVKSLVDAGVHFGHRVSRWNPKMEPYIHGKRNMIHIIDVKETIKGLLLAKRLVQQTVASGKDVLFVGTKRQARHAVEEEAKRSGMHYVSERWLGGTLTNFRTIRSRLKRLEELESILDGEQALSYSKKMISTLSRERTKIDRNLAGIRNMTRLPEALLVVDPHREHIAVEEARRLEIPIVAMVDTNCDPDLIDVIIPANDDAIRAVKLICQKMADAILEGRQEYDAAHKEATPEDMGYKPATDAGDEGGEPGAPRGRRTPRVYEPEEDEYPIGGYEEPAAEATEGQPAADETAPSTDESIAQPAPDASGSAPEKPAPSTKEEGE